MEPTPARPKSLKLEFSKAADLARVSRIFDPAVKDAADPHHYVAKRLSAAFKKAVDGGCAAFFSDPSGDVKALTVAYHISVDKNAPETAQHDYTEFGTTISFVPGYHSTVPVIAALSLREWFNHAPKHKLAADIKEENGPSVKVYQDTLGWEIITDHNHDAAIDKASWRTIPDEKADPTLQTGYEAVPASGASMDWYECSDKTLVKDAQILLDAIKRGGLVNKAGDVIPVDFSALDAEGLTKPRLEAIAKGMTDRKALLKL